MLQRDGLSKEFCLNPPRCIFDNSSGSDLPWISLACLHKIARHWYWMAEYHKRTARTTRQRECRFCNVTRQSLCIVSRSTLSSIKTTETYKARQWLLWDFSIISDILLSEANKPRASLLNCGNGRIPPYRVSSGIWESFSMFAVDTD